MKEIKLGLIESRFADIIWENEPLSTKDLISRCEKEFNWKRTTTYTVLKKLCEKGLFQVENSVITSKLSKEKFLSIQSEAFIDETFKGSLPAFLAAFTSQKPISKEDLEEIKKMIDSF